MPKLLSILFIAFLLFGCGDSDRQPKEKADRLTQQAEEEIRKQNYDEAERMLAESIEIHSETNNEAKLAENYSALSSVQLLSGKLSPALETLLALRGIYQHAADRNAELQTMLQIGRIYFQLGKKNDALAILNEAYNNSRLFRLNQITIQSAIALSALYAALNKPEKALTYSANAHTASKEQNEIPRLPADVPLAGLLDALCIEINSLVALGKIDEAFELFREGESYIGSNTNINEPNFYVQCGKAFAYAEEWAFAKANFESALSLIEKKSQYRNAPDKIYAHIGIAEIYFHHFAFAEAQQHFTQAYNLAKDQSDAITQAYLLVRVADCLSKRSGYVNSQDGIIRASQLYEQAQTLFARSGFGLGEAISLHRLGALKELSYDDNAAMTFYKRAFDKFSEHTVSPIYYSLSVNIEQLCSTPSKRFSLEEWFSENLISLLLKYKRTSEALPYLESVRTIQLQSQLYDLSLQFRDPTKNNRYSEFQKAIALRNQHQLELHHLNMMRQQNNKNYARKLQQQITYAKSKMLSDAVTLAQEFPVFLFQTVSQKTSLSNIAESMPSSFTILDYCFVGNEAWVFVIRPEEEITAVKLSSYGYELTKKMNRFIGLLNSPTKQTGDLQKLSDELYSFLVKPIESFGRRLDSSSKQRFTIIPPIQFEKFPFHALTENGTSLIEMIGVSYLPHLSFVQDKPALPRFINNVVTFGFTSDSRWGLEFELRDTRSFFRNTQVNVNQSATIQKLESSLGEIIQISSQYKKNADGDFSFTLSDGSTSKAGTEISISKFTSLHPFQIVYLSDVQSAANNISDIHPLLWMLNGSASVVAAQFPITSNVSKTFGENFYSTLSSEINPALAYRRAVIQLGKKKEFAEGFSAASYFYYGVR